MSDDINKARILTFADYCELQSEIAHLVRSCPNCGAPAAISDVLQAIFKKYKNAKPAISDKEVKRKEHQGAASRYLEICSECTEKEKESLKKSIFLVIDEWFDNRENEKCGLGKAEAEFEKFNVHTHADGTIHCPGREDY